MITTKIPMAAALFVITGPGGTGIVTVPTSTGDGEIKDILTFKVWLGVSPKLLLAAGTIQRSPR